MKKIFLFIITCVLMAPVFSQVKISDMPTYVGNPAGGYVPVVINGVNRKVDPVYFSKIDSVSLGHGNSFDSVYLWKSGAKMYNFRIPISRFGGDDSVQVGNRLLNIGTNDFNIYRGSITSPLVYFKGTTNRVGIGGEPLYGLLNVWGQIAISNTNGYTTFIETEGAGGGGRIVTNTTIGTPNSPEAPLRVRLTALNVPQVGFGVALPFEAENAAGVNRTIANFKATYSTITNGSENAEITIQAIKTGIQVDRLSIDENGKFRIPSYGTGSLAGTPTYYAAFDATGNLIEAPPPSGGGGGSGSVGSGSQYQLGYYASAGTTITPVTIITGSRALSSDANGLPVASSVTSTEQGYVSGVTGPIQTQINGKAALSHTHSMLTDATGILPSANGGTSNAFTQFTGPSGSEKIYTLPNANTTILTSNAAVTAPQGGTGITTYAVGDITYAASSSTLGKLPSAASGNVLLSGGVATPPMYGKVGLTTHVSGILPRPNGGIGMDPTGLTGFLFSNGSAFNIAPSIDLSSGQVTDELPTTRGGTNFATYGKGDILIGSTAGALDKLAGNTSNGGKVLVSYGNGTANTSTSLEDFVTTTITSMQPGDVIGSVTGSGLSNLSGAFSDNALNMAKANGSEIWAWTYDPAFSASASSMSNNVGRLYEIHLPTAGVVHGVKFIITTEFTGGGAQDDFNGAVAYTESGGVLTQVATTTNQTTLWTTPGLKKLTFTSTYSAAKGKLYILIPYSVTGASTQAAIMGTSTASNTNATTLDYTNNNLAQGTLSVAATPASTYNLSALTAHGARGWVGIW